MKITRTALLLSLVSFSSVYSNTCRDLEPTIYSNCTRTDDSQEDIPAEVRIKSTVITSFKVDGLSYSINQGDRAYFVQYVDQNGEVTSENLFKYNSSHNIAELTNASIKLQKILGVQEGVDAQTDANMANLEVDCSGDKPIASNTAEGDKYELYKVEAEENKLNVTDSFTAVSFSCEKTQNQKILDLVKQ
ncbi:hypothetical protein N9N67_00280 [Bacteriovoracaceae bacterium]|nr:hypothetical protein [Bacteriovoracaceae bacterium]